MRRLTARLHLHGAKTYAALLDELKNPGSAVTTAEYNLFAKTPSLHARLSLRCRAAL